MSKSIDILGVEEDGQEEVFGEFVLGKRCRKKHFLGRRCIGAKAMTVTIGATTSLAGMSGGKTRSKLRKKTKEKR